MAYAPPSRIGRYEVLAPLGRGGMGLVYLARDATLDREVAIKVLPDEVAKDPERLRWFEREAKILASLNHPNIAIVYGFESAPEGERFLVLERIVGETLAERFRRGLPSVADATGICSQIADALEAAHERGIVHRDLKPGNVMVSPRGRVKVLDFGLAKRLVSGDSGPETAMLGTPGYASPEQIRGEPVDTRGDLFALGCILYECLAGRRAFSGSSVAGTIEATLREDPDWGALPDTIPPALRSLLVRCLEKRADARPPRAAEVSRVLADLRGARPLSAAGVATDSSAPASRLPAPLTRFIGRERELAECFRLLGRTRLLTLIGVPGGGKTRLALEMAGGRFGSFPDGVHFLDLAPLRDGVRLLETVAAAIGERESPGVALEASVLGALRHKTVLLLLDNCEHLAAPVAVLAQRLLQACPGLKLLATSREALGISGEQIFPVEPFALPDPADRKGPNGPLPEAMEFFQDRARLADPDFAVTDENAAVVVEICRRLDGIPLALELAAARLQVLSLAQIRERLEDRFRLLAGPSRVATQHHRTLHAAVEFSYDQMADLERSVFRRLAVFAGGWTLEGAAAVAEDGRDEFATLDLLMRLWNKSLLVVDRAVPAVEPRYRYLETIREFALDRLAESGEEAVIRDRHLEYSIELAERTYPMLSGRDQAAGLSRLAPEHHNFLEASAWCERAGGRDGRALVLVSNLWSFWMLRCEYAAGRRAMGPVLDRPGARERTVVRARALYGAGWLASLQGDRPAARALMEQSLAIANEIDDPKAISRALAGLGVVALDAGDFTLAREYGLQSLAMNRRIGNEKGVSAALTGLGNLAFREGDFEGSERFMAESLALSRRREDLEGIAGSLSNLSEVWLRLGKQEDARRALHECLECSRAIEAKHIMAVGLANVSKVASAAGDAWPAARLAGAAEAVWEATGYALSGGDREDHEAVLTRLSDLLGADRLERARREGSALPLDEAIDEALRYLDGSEGDAATL